MNKTDRQLTKQFRKNRNQIKKCLNRLNTVQAQIQWEITHSDDKSFEDTQDEIQPLIKQQRKQQMKLFRYNPAAAAAVVTGAVPGY